MIKIICCLLLLNFVQKGICMGSGQDLILALDYRLIESLSNLGTLVLSQYFNHTRCLIFLSEGESGRLILNEMKVKLSGYYFHVFFPTAETSDMDSLIKLIHQGMDEACFGLVMIVRDPKVYFDAYFEATKLAIVRGEVIILHLVTPGEKRSDISDWSPDVWSSLPASVFSRCLFTRLNGMNEVQLVSQRFVGRDFSKEYQVARWLNGTRLEPKKVNLYPDKTRNLRGKQLRVIPMFDYRPNTVVFNEVPEWHQKAPGLFDLLFTSEEIGMDGLEYRILEAYATHHNASLIFSFELEQWGDIFPNGTGFGAMGRIAAYEAEFSIGAFYLWHPQWYFVDYTVPFTQAGMSCLAPKPHTISTWLLIIMPFTWDMWLAVGLSIVLATFALYLAATRPIFLNPGLYGTWSRSLLAVWGIMVDQAPPQARGALGDKEDTLTAHMINILLLSFLLVSSGYSGGLSSILTLIRYESPIETSADLIMKNISWVSNDGVFLLSLLNSDNEKYKKLIDLFKVYDSPEIQRRARLGEICVVYEAITGDHYALNDYITQDTIPYLRKMKNELYSSYEVILLRKYSPYLYYLNQVMSRLWESGITLYLSEVSVLGSMDTRLQIAIRNSRYVDQPKEIPLRIEHIQAALSLLLLGLAGSLLIFVYELIHSKMISSRVKTFKF